MKKMIRAAFVLCLLFALSGCGKKEATVVKTYAATDVLDVEKGRTGSDDGSLL